MTEVLPEAIAKTIVDPKAYADDIRLHDALTWARQNNPLGRAEIEGFDPFWIVTKHADILEIGRQNDLFHNGDREATITDRAGSAMIRKMTGGSPHLIRTLVQMDAPDHPKYRAMTQAWFMPTNIKKLEERIRHIARKTIDRMAEKGDRCDFVSDVALGYPLHVIMEILGVPEKDEPLMLALTQNLFGARDADVSGGKNQSAEDTVLHVQNVFETFSKYFSRLTIQRRENPGDDLATTIANATVDGKPISDAEAMGYYIIVATAGHDTTSSSTAGAVWALCEFPDEFAKLKANRALIPSFVDEAVRWTTPVKHFMRTATRDTEIRGRRIAKGDWLMLCYPSGNRDEEVFEDPFVFRSDRSPNRQLAFGYGAHLCLGQHLAKMEMRILFEELLARLESVAFDGEPARSEANFVSGPKRLPIRYKLA